jgi:hypothetical protein
MPSFSHVGGLCDVQHLLEVMDVIRYHDMSQLTCCASVGHELDDILGPNIDEVQSAGKRAPEYQRTNREVVICDPQNTRSIISTISRDSPAVKRKDCRCGGHSWLKVQFEASQEEDEKRNAKSWHCQAHMTKARVVFSPRCLILECLARSIRTQVRSCFLTGFLLIKRISKFSFV